MVDNEISFNTKDKVTDSTIVIKKKIEVLIQIDDIEYLEIGKLNKEKTSYAIGIPAIALFTILSFMFVYISNSLLLDTELINSLVPKFTD